MNKRLSNFHYEVYTVHQLQGTDLLPHIDEVIHTTFGHTNLSVSYVNNFSDDTLVALMKDDKSPFAVALAEKLTYDTDPEMISPVQIFVHSIAIHRDYQGRGLCKGFVKYLLRCIKDAHGKVPIHLNVRVTKDNVNIGAIRCYENNGFRFVNVPPISKEDGPNAFMIKDGYSSKKRTNTRRKRGRLTRKR